MITKSIPNLCTLFNLGLGMVAILLSLNDNYSLAAIMVIVAMLMDGLDGRMARALNAQSELGKELDSLSDLVSFGVAPIIIMYGIAFHDINPVLAVVASLIFPMCGAMRLARFNVKAGVPGYFTGLPIPAAGGVLATLSLFHNEVSTPYMVISTLILSYLMVSRVKYPNFKKVGVPRKALWLAPFVIIVAVVIAIMFPDQVSKLIFVPLALYALYGFQQNIRQLTRRRKHQDEDNSSKESLR
ncbi:CDP-diacylglycerol--serine O-phosphatidyltransferase [Paenibacillus bovis]|uniref:CDP-diacylglycerol--serine O-phosphatidyltransferase n=1 Tax=Paenibacillus bovis TaxID=1616788 RepID=A0A172ZL84_9BACL|nr:CDP-diacylglycerol--serine O-phosphatidyltransferase [Paenibacillus bovis]ANF98411.1 CDP-diacylglycerol--serine O-phosphatidyltransferase [Paenibacillus bovis]